VSGTDELRRAIMIFAIGDYLVGMLVGVTTALSVRMVVRPGMDMVIAMIVGMALGMLVHLVLGLAFGPLIGMFEAMIPASLIGMYGGMFFGMPDSMAAGSRTLPAALAVGAIFGAIVVAGVHYYDRTLRGPVVDTGE
jgi:hypothetical protein